jgi:hypothetical protein
MQDALVEGKQLMKGCRGTTQALNIQGYIKAPCSSSADCKGMYRKLPPMLPHRQTHLAIDNAQHLQQHVFASKSSNGTSSTVPVVIITEGPKWHCLG